MTKKKKNTPSVKLSEDTQPLIELLEQRFAKLETMIVNNNSKTTIPDVMQPKEICSKFGWSRSRFETATKKDNLFRTFKIGGTVYVYTSEILALFPKDTQ